MNAADVVGYTHDGEFLCPDCAAQAGLDLDGGDPEVGAVFADSEWDSWPYCPYCDTQCRDVSLTAVGIEYEACHVQGVEMMHMTKADIEGHGPDSCWYLDGEPLEPGFYYWYCQPGCLPDSDPIGPFETKEDMFENIVEGQY